MASQIREFYTNKCVLLTGASGFVGKQVLEKLLRSCSDIKCIYILLRRNKKHTATERFNTMLTTPLFNLICESSGNVMKMVKVVEGDILLPHLGIVDDPLYAEIVENVSIVFHLAATVNFNEPIKMAIDMNIIGLKKILDLCDMMPMIQALVHVSTAYSNCTQYEIGEKIYPASVSYTHLLRASEWLSDDVMNLMTKRITKSHPNTYTFTKAVAEEMLVMRQTKYPIAVFRPSIVSASINEPFPVIF